MKCKICSTHCIRKGRTNCGIQRYLCKNCGKYQQNNYRYNSCAVSNQQIIQHVKEGVGIRSMSRLLHISPTTVISRILSIASKIRQPMITQGKSYEMDEMATYIGNKNKRIWIVYALQRKTNLVVNFSVGPRSNKTLRMVSNTLLLSSAKRIYTDKWRGYLSLIPKSVHITKQYSINHIERMNLTIRTHLKRLNRRTICFTRSLRMLKASLKIYFWS